MTQNNIFRNSIGGTIRLTSKVLYRILSPSLCTRLACSPLGKAIGKIIAPQHETVYTCDHGIKLRLSRSDAVTSGIAHMGRTNPLETDLLLQHLKPGDTMIEIGTYKDGWLALVGSGIIGRSGRVIGFEPIPDYCRQFKRNVELNKRDNIAIEPLAVSDAVGTATFSLRDTNSSMVLQKGVADETITVNTTTLDAYCASHGIDAIDLLIVDTEGAESMVLRGGQKMFTKTTCLIIEIIDDFCRQAGTSAEKLIRNICTFGFSPYAITRRGLVPWQPGMQSETLNMFFVNNELSRRRQEGSNPSS